MIKTSEYIDYLFEKVAIEENAENAENVENAEKANYDVLNNKGVESRKNRTSILKDRITPLVKNQGAGLIAGTVGATLGGALGYGGYTASRAARKALLNPNNIEKAGKHLGPTAQKWIDSANNLFKAKTKAGRFQKPIKMLFSDEYKQARRIAATASGAASLGSKFKETGKVLDRTQDYQKKHLKTFGTEPTEDEYLKASGINVNNPKHNLALKMFHTPEAMIKSKKRDVSLENKIKNYKRLDDKMALLNINEMEKRALDFNRLKRLGKEGVGELRGFTQQGYNGLKNYTKNMSKAQKAVAGAGAGITGGASMYSSSRLVDDDDKMRPAKLVAGGTVGAGLGGVVADRVGKDMFGLGESVKEKVENPEILKENAKKIINETKDDIKKTVIPAAKKAWGYAAPKVQEVVKEGVRGAMSKETLRNIINSMK